MITLAETLRPADVLLDLVAASPVEAAEKLLARLKDDERVLDWAAFHAAILAHPPCRVADDAPFGMCIPHARTTAVGTLVIAAARLAADTPFPECERPVRYIFCLGVPQTMALDYLRIAGLLMRIFTDREAEEKLHTATTGAAFVEALAGLETRLS